MGNFSSTRSMTVASSSTWSLPHAFISVAMARATTSRGASSFMGWYPGMNRSPLVLYKRAPAPRTASETKKLGWPGMARAVGWNWTNSISISSAPAR